MNGQLEEAIESFEELKNDSADAFTTEWTQYVSNALGEKLNIANKKERTKKCSLKI